MTKTQREYTRQYVTVSQSPAQKRGEKDGWTVYIVTHNPLMATMKRKIITTAKTYREAAIIAQGYTARGDIRLHSSVEVY